MKRNRHEGGDSVSKTEVIISAIFFVMLVIGYIISKLDKIKTKNNIIELRKEIKNLAKCECGYTDFNENLPEEIQLHDLKNRADMLKFCFLCPLYQDKVKHQSNKENE